MDKRRSFVGQLYRGEAQTKSWSQIVSGHVTIRLFEGEEAAGEWKLAAFKKEKVWECRLDPRLKFRVKNDFVQWQMKGAGGETLTYGIRLKDAEVASQLSEKIGEVLNAMMSKPPEADEVQLRVLLSGRDPTLLTVRNSTTMIQVLRMYCQKKQLDVSQFIISLPPDSSHPPVKPSTTVGSLGNKEVQVVKKATKASSSTAASALATPPTEGTDSNGLAANEQLLQVELPRDERTVVRVSAQITMADLLKYICEKRNLDIADHRFDLPATEESLAGKTIEQLKITSIRVVLREGAKKREEHNGHDGVNKSPSRVKRKSTRKNRIETASESPKGNRRQAPPPPPPLQSRRTQPNLIKELAVAAEKKATLRRVGNNSDPESTPPERRQTFTTSGDGGPPPPLPGDADSEYPMERSPELDRKGKTPLLPSISRTALLPKSIPAPPPPAPASKATPTTEAPHSQGVLTKTESELSRKAAAPPPVPNKPKKKRAMSLEDYDEPDSAPQAPPTNHDEEVGRVVEVVDMDTLMEESESVEPAVKKVKKKVKRKPTLEDSTLSGQKEKKTKSGKTTKKKKKANQSDKNKEELPREESVEREDGEWPSPQPPQDFPPPEEERQLQQRDRETEQVPPTTSAKPLTPDFKQRHTTSLRRRPKGPAPPPPPGSKTMTLGRIRQVDGDIPPKSRGFTMGGNETQNGRPISDEIVTKPRSLSEAPLPIEKVEVRGTPSPTQFGTRHRPTRKAPSRPAPSTPQGKEKVRGDKEREMKARSGSGSPRRPPPTVPPNIPPAVPPTQMSADSGSDGDVIKTEKTRKNHVSFSEEVETTIDVGGVTEENGVESSQLNNFTSSKPPLTPPRQKQHKMSPGQSPSGRRRDAATVVCKDTEDGGKEVIINPSPHSKRKLAGPLIFKMPPPPSTPPTKSKAKKPPKAVKAEMKEELAGYAAAAVENKEMITESADTSFGENGSEMLAGSMKVTSPPSLSDTLVSNEFTNLDEMLGDSHQDIVTTDFSIEENLEPIDEYGGLEWNESALTDSNSGIPYQDPDISVKRDIYSDDYDLSENAAAALNFNSNNNNNGLGADNVFDYRNLPPPVVPSSPEEDSDEWERDSNRTGELNFDSSSSAAELSKHSIDDGEVALEEEEGQGGVVLLKVKRMDEEVADFLPEQTKQDAQEGWTGKTSLTTSSIRRDPSTGTLSQLNELDDVVSSLAELAAEVPDVAPPSPPPPPPSTLSQLHPLTSSTPSREGEEHRPTSPEPPPIPISLPPALTPPDEEDDDFPLGPPPAPPSVSPSSPSSPESGDRKQVEADYELLNKLKQRQLKSTSSRRRRRGSRDQEVDDGESALLEKLKERQAKYRQKSRVRYEDAETGSMSSADQFPIPVLPEQGDGGSHSIPSSAPQQPGIGTGSGMGTGGDNVQLQLQFLQQQVLQQQMMQLQQQFQSMHGYAFQQGVSMPTNVMLPGGAMMNQPGTYMAPPMAPPTGAGLVGQPPQMLVQTSAGQVLIPATSMPQMVPGQGVMPNPQAVPMMPPGQVPQMPQTSMHGQGLAPNVAMPVQQQQVVYGQGVVQSQLPQPPLMSTSVTADKASLPGRPDNSDITLSGRPDNQDTLLGRPNDKDGSANTNLGTTVPLVTPSKMSGRKRSEDVRTLILGPLEEQFDSLMDQVRDANTAVLKKVPEDDDKDKEPSYTGMAAALAEALKQRRMHVADKRRSIGELDESNNSEWQSP